MWGLSRFASVLSGVVAISLFACRASAASNADPEGITEPHWLERPSSYDVAAAYPDRAQRERISGRAIMACAVGSDGRLYECRVFAEAPVGEGFGAATLSLAPKFRMAPPPRSQPGVAPTIFVPVRMVIIGPGMSRDADPSPKSLVLENLRWARAPSFDEMAAAYPKATGAAAGDVDMRCHVAPDGASGPCKVLNAQPAHMGFAEAALALAPEFRLDMGGRQPGPADDFSAELHIHFVDPASEAFRNRDIGRPVWIKAPGEDEAAALFPATAAARGLKTGRGVAACDIATDGRLQNCMPRPGEPDGLGFSEAAVKVASMMRMNPWTTAGGPVAGAHVELPIRFDISDSKH